MNTPPQPGAKKITAFVFVLLVAPLVLLVGLEFASRIAINLFYGVPGKTYGIYRADAVLGHYPAPNTYNHLSSMNDFGFRNVEDVISPKPEGAERVIAYGGSTTFCPKLTTEECWSRQLEKRMRKGEGNAAHQVLNGGVVLWSLGHVLERAKRDLPKLKPDKVIIYSGFNEEANTSFLRLAGTPIDQLVAQGSYGVAAANFPSSEWFSLHSVLFKMARGAIVSGSAHFFKPKDKASFIADAPPSPGKEASSSGNSPASMHEIDPATMKNYLVTLERLVQLIRRNGAEPLMLIQASSKPIPGTKISLTGAKLVCGMGVRVLDSREAFTPYQGPRDDLFGSDIHYSAKGAALLADYLYDRLYKRKGFNACSKL